MLKSILSPITGIIFAGVILVVGLLIVGNKHSWGEHPSDVHPTGTFRTTTLLVDNRAGVGTLTPSVKMDVRSDSTVNNDLTYSGWRNSQTATGEREQFVRQRGTMASPTTTLVTDGILRRDIYGVNTGNTLTQGAEQDVNQDQSAGAASVPMDWQWKTQDTAGTMRAIVIFDSAGHWNAPTSVAPVLSACGGSPTIVGSDVAGTITVGTAISTCTLTFNVAYNVTNPSFTAHCTVSSRTASSTIAYTPSNATIVITGAAAGEIIDYTCIGAS